jgi:Carboxypeptidase regulatory-like domain
MSAIDVKGRRPFYLLRRFLCFTRLVVPILVISLSAVMQGQVQSPLPKPANEPTTGSISGKIVNEHGQPVIGATLFVRAAGSFATGRTTVSDAEGSFRVNNLDSGLYTLIANAPGYITVPADPNAPPSYYRIGDSVRLELVRGGVITGVVTNALGEPVVAVRVRAGMVRDAKGQPPKMASAGLMEQPTDDRGVYRMYGLAPGNYLVSAGGFGTAQSFQFNPYDSDLPTYAPSSARDNAVEVSVRGGEESSADIRYRAEAGFSISGTVKLAGTTGATIMLTSVGGSYPVANAFQVPGGRGFAFNGIANGDYDLVAQEINTSQNPTAPVLALSERKRVTVKGASVTGIELVPRPLASVRGRISLESSKAPECQGKRPPSLAEMIVRLQRPEKEAEKENLPYLLLFGGSATPDSNGTFAFSNVSPGKYQFEPRFYARYWYLQSITLGGSAAVTKPKSPTPVGKIDAAANWTVVKSGDQVTNLIITLAEGAASLRGRLAAADAATGLSLYVVPAEQDKAEDVLRFFVTEIAADGTFVLNNLPPGRYFVLAQAAGAETATLAKLRLPESATSRAKLRRTAETQKAEIDLKPCQNLTDYQIK